MSLSDFYSPSLVPLNPPNTIYVLGRGGKVYKHTNVEAYSHYCATVPIDDCLIIQTSDLKTVIYRYGEWGGVWDSHLKRELSPVFGYAERERKPRWVANAS